MRFEDIVIEPSNEIALKASEMVVESPGKHYPLLLIQGLRGSGKTALLKTIINKAKSHHHVKFYGQSEKFLENLDILLIDDLQKFQFEREQQEELYRILKCRLVNRRQTVITTDKPIYQFEVISENLELLLMEALIIELK